MEIFEVFLHPNAWMAILTLTFLELVLGIDNLVFLSILSSKLPKEQQGKARIVGLFLAMAFRILLLFSVSWLMTLSKPLITFDTKYVDGSVSGQSIIIFLGGLFLLYKSVTEIHHKLEDNNLPDGEKSSSKVPSFWAIIAQIVLIDAVFSIDSVLTAVGMVSFTEFGYGGAMSIMVIAVVLAMMGMMFFSGPISKFVNDHPTIQMLALSFLILIAVMLLAESAHLSQLNIFDNYVSAIPKGYIYFSIAFALLVEVLNMKMSKKKKKKLEKNK